MIVYILRDEKSKDFLPVECEKIVQPGCSWNCCRFFSAKSCQLSEAKHEMVLLLPAVIYNLVQSHGQLVFQWETPFHHARLVFAISIMELSVISCCSSWSYHSHKTFLSEC
jgi:hypothetical protein